MARTAGVKDMTHFGVLLTLLLLGCGGPASAPAATTTAGATATVAGATNARSGTASAPETARMEAPPRQALHFGDVPSIALAPLYVGIERGYFAAEGIDVDLVNLTAGADSVAMLGSAQLDASAGGVSAGFFNAVQRGIPIRIVAPMSLLPETGGASPLLVRQELAGRVSSAADLKGARVGVVGKAAVQDYLLTKLLARGGLTLADIDPIPLAQPDIPLALANGAIDFAISAEPFATRATSSGAAQVFVDAVLPGFMNTTVFFGEPLRGERAAVGEGFVVGLMRAARDLQGGRAKSEEIIGILAQYTRLAPEVLRQSSFNSWDPDLTIQKDALLDQQTVHLHLGQMTYRDPLPVEGIVDERFRQAALARLGPYQP